MNGESIPRLDTGSIPVSSINKNPPSFVGGFFVGCLELIMLGTQINTDKRGSALGRQRCGRVSRLEATVVGFADL